MKGTKEGACWGPEQGKASYPIPFSLLGQDVIDVFVYSALPTVGGGGAGQRVTLGATGGRIGPSSLSTVLQLSLSQQSCREGAGLFLRPRLFPPLGSFPLASLPLSQVE